MPAHRVLTSWVPLLASALVLVSLALLCLMLAFGAARQQSSLPFTVLMLDDPAVMTPQQAQQSAASQWQPLANPASPLGYGRGQLWFEVRLQPKDGYVLQLDAPFLDQVDFYLLKPSGEMVGQVLTGDQRSFTSRLLPVSNYLLPVSQQWQTDQLQLFLRIHNVGQTILPLSYREQTQAVAQATRLQILQSFFLGLMLFAAVLTALSAVVTHQYHLLLFSGLLVCIAIVQAEMAGFLFQWLWPGQPQLNHLTEWAIPLAVWCCAGFVLRYFSLDQSRLRKPLLWFQWLAIGLLVVLFVLKILPDDYWLAMHKQLAVLLMQGCVVLTLAVGCFMLKRQTQRAVLFLLPMSVLLSSVVLAGLRVLGVLPDSVLARVVFELGSTMAAVLMCSNLLVSMYLEKARQTRTQQLLLERHQQLTQLQQKELERSRIAPFYQLGSRLALVELLQHELQQQRQDYRLLLIEFNQFNRLEAVLGRAQLAEVVNAYVDSLQVLARRLSQAVVSLGEERHQTFFALAPNRLVLLVHQRQFVAVLGSIRKLLHRKFAVAGLTPDLEPRYASVSIEPAMGPEAEDLLAHAALALTYVENVAGHVSYQPQFSAQSRQRLALLAALAHAISQGQFYLLFQPVQTLGLREDSGHRCESVEAFLRWQHPQFGAVSPATFIPLAEEAGLIGSITAWVYKEVRRAQNQLAEQGFALPVSMNLSALDLQNPALLVEILRNESKYPPTQKVQFELAESALTPDSGAAQKSLQLLQKSNTLLVMDDYGAGQSMLAKLGTLPIGTLKVDMTLLTLLESNREQLLAGTIRLGKALDMRVICEGVETERQLEFLTIHGADAAQGYLIARPMPLADLLSWFAARTVKKAAVLPPEYMPQRLDEAQSSEA